jgi:transglutaminase-like putative cysteine protease
VLERLVVWLARALWRRAVILLLLGTLVGVLAFSVDQAGWVPGVQPGLGVWLGLLVGVALARSRLSGRRSLAYATLVLMAGAAQQVGRLLPPLVQLQVAPGDWVWSLHLRTLTLGQRVGAWATAIAHGQPVNDTGLFVWMFSLLVWGAAVWLAWSVLRRRRALIGAVPGAIILAANTTLSGQPWQEVLLFLAATLGLMAYATYVRQHADWNRRGVDYPGELGLEWYVPVTGVMLAIGLLTAAGPVLGTPHAWSLLSNMLASPRQQVAQTANQLFSGVKPPAAQAAAPVAWTPDLSRIGNGIDQSQATVMWVKTDEPAPENYPGAPPPPQHYWRAGIYVTYTGTGWQPMLLAAEATGPGKEPVPAAGRYGLRQQFEIVAAHGQSSFAANQPETATAGVQVLANAPASGGRDDATTLLVGPASSYSVLSFAPRLTEAQLRAASTDYPPAIRSAYLQLPVTLPARVRALAEQITRGAADPYDQAQRLEKYLRETYAYTLAVPPPPPGQDAVDYFLYEAPGGFCSYYASAMAVMLRTLGVPARLATGYAMGDYDPSRDAYRVPGAAAHAWVEVYFASYGWVEFEPTSSQAPFTRPSGESQTVGTPVAAVGGAQATQLPAPAWLMTLAAAAALLAAVVWYRQRRRDAELGAAAPRQRALRLYRQIRRSLAQAGFAASASVTPDEYLATTLSALSTRPALLEAVTEATALFREAAYSAHALSEARARAAQQLWSDARLSRLRLIVARLVRHARLGRRQ